MKTEKIKKFSKALKEIVEKYKKRVKSSKDFEEFEDNFRKEIEKLTKDHEISFENFDKLEQIFTDEDIAYRKLSVSCISVLLVETKATKDDLGMEKYEKVRNILIKTLSKPNSEPKIDESLMSEKIIIKKSLH